MGLPDALDLMVICVEAGMGLDAAINRVAGEIKLTSPVLSEEFTLLNLELRAGKSRQDALRNLAYRTDIHQLESLVTLLIQTDRFGTSVANALRVYSDSFRTQRFSKGRRTGWKNGRQNDGSVDSIYFSGPVRCNCRAGSHRYLSDVFNEIIHRGETDENLSSQRFTAFPAKTISGALIFRRINIFYGMYNCSYEHAAGHQKSSFEKQSYSGFDAGSESCPGRQRPFR